MTHASFSIMKCTFLRLSLLLMLILGFSHANVDKHTGKSSFLEEKNPYKSNLEKSSFVNNADQHSGKADVLLAGLFPITSADEREACTRIQPEEGIQPLEAMYYVIDQLNKDVRFSRHFRLGMIPIDTCDNSQQALNRITDLLTVRKTTVNGSAAFVCPSGGGVRPADLSTDAANYAKVVGIVGARSSAVSMSVASLLQYFKVPQVSYLSTSSDLSNILKYSYFMRTVPSDLSLARVFVNLMLKYSWTYVSIVHDDSSYGRRGVFHVDQLGRRMGICFPLQISLSTTNVNDTDYRDIVERLYNQRKARVVLLYSNGRQHTRNFLLAIKSMNLSNHFVFLGPDGIADKTELTSGLDDVMHRTIAVTPSASEIPGYNTYFQGLSSNYSRHEWWSKYWEQTYDCSLNESGNRPCPQTAPPGFKQRSILHYVADAVYTFAFALLAVQNHSEYQHASHTRFDPRSVYEAENNKLFLNTLRGINFTSITGTKFEFTNKVDGPPWYTIWTYQTSSPRGSGWLQVGSYDAKDARGYDQQNLQLQPWFEKYIVDEYEDSICSKPCLQGEARIWEDYEGCCWFCQNCSSSQIVSKENELIEQCIECNEGYRANIFHNSCMPISPMFFGITTNISIQVAAAVTCAGVILAVITITLFLVYRNTPIIKATGRELSSVLLVAALLLYLAVFVYTAAPSVVICTLTRLLLGLSYTVVYAALLVKTNRIDRIFAASKDKSIRSVRYTESKSQLLIAGGLVLVQAAVLTAWLVADRPEVKHLYPDGGHVIVCKSAIGASYIVALSYPFLLLVFCTIYAFRTRKTPDGFNEARSIAFLCCTTLIAWLAAVTLILTATNYGHEGFKRLIISLASCLNATILLACLFWPKLYICILHPDKNTREAVMARTKSVSVSSVLTMRDTNIAGTQLSHIPARPRSESTIVSNTSLTDLTQVAMDLSTEREQEQQSLSTDQCLQTDVSFPLEHNFDVRGTSPTSTNLLHEFSVVPEREGYK